MGIGVVTVNGHLRGAMVGTPLRFISNLDGKEYVTLSKIEEITDHNEVVVVKTEDGITYSVNKN